MISLYADEDIPLPLVKALRRQGINVLTTPEAMMLGKTDEEQLQYASSRDLTLFTHNTKDFVLLHHKFQQEGKEHSGIIVSKKEPLRILLKRMLHLVFTLNTESIKNRMEFLSNW